MFPRILTFFLILVPAFSFAWGGDGHRIVGAIAETRLTTKTLESVREILGDVPMASVASWADAVRNERPATAPWHYVNIHIDRNEMSLWDCPNNDCVTMIITDQEAFLRRWKIAPPVDREESLKYLIHFVGDQAQPLHNANEDDLGGNTKKVRWFGRDMNLHSVWDSGFILRYYNENNSNEKDFFKALNTEIRPEQVRIWIRGTSIDWSNEAHRVAIEVAYPGWDAGLDDEYYSKGIGTVRLQLQKGGIRLAHILNRLFDSEYNGDLSVRREARL